MKTVCSAFYTDPEAFLPDFERIMKSKCDWMEIRLDKREIQHEKEMDILFHEIRSFLQAADKPLIITYRTMEEGGCSPISSACYEKLIHLLTAEVQKIQHTELLDEKDVPPVMIDIELARLEKMVHKPSTDTAVISFHDFDKTPDTPALCQIWKSMQKWHPAIEKIACMPNNAADTARLLETCLEHTTDSRKIAISMGETGQISRIIGDRFESCASFVVLEAPTAPGQLQLDQLQAFLNERDAQQPC